MTSQAPKKVAVTGVNGTLGHSVVTSLLAAGHSVTALTTRPEETAKTWNDKITIVKADYSSATSLALSLRGHDIVVSLLSRFEIDVSNLVTDAAIEAGVKYIIPSCFGGDNSIPEFRSSPGLQVKVLMEDYVVERAREGKIVFTGIQTGMLLDWAISHGVILNTKRPNPVFDGGNTEFSVSWLEDIGRAVAVAVTKAGSEETRNKFLLMHNGVVTQNQLLGYAKEVRPDLEWKVIPLDTQVLYDESKAKYDRGERSVDDVRGFILRLTFGLGLNVFRKTDNKVLGIEEWDATRFKRKISDLLNQQK